jgi:hypothetical protein
MPTRDELKALQVKAELSKLPDAPRAYNDKINLDENMMSYDFSNQANGQSKLSLNDRFSKI